MARLATDQAVRIDSGRDEHHVLDRPRDHTVAGSERLDDGDLRVHDRADQHCRRLGTGGQHLLQTVQSGSNQGIWARSAKVIDADQIAGGKSMGSCQHLGRSDPDQRTQRGQLGVEPHDAWQPPFGILGQGRRSPGSTKQSLPGLIMINFTMTSITQCQIHCRKRCCDRRRHALEPSKIGNRVEHR